MARTKDNNKRLRKQPKMRRMQSATAVNLPRASMPKTVKKRRRRNNQQGFKRGLLLLKRFVFTSRWLSLGLLLLAIYALYTVGMNERYYLTTVPVEGSVTIPAHEIAQASGLAGVHVFAADPNLAAAAIADVPGVISAEVSLSWPNEVAIRVVEDTPIAVWRQDGQSYWINSDGDLLPARTGSIGLLVIDAAGVSRPEATVADEASAEAETAVVPPTPAGTTTAGPTFISKEVLAGALLLQQLRPELESLSYDPGSGLYFEDNRGWRASFGTGTDMEQKVVVYEAIVASLTEEGITPSLISVSNQEKPYYRIGQ